MSKIIEVVVAPEGSSKIETKGFRGASCQDASRFIEQALGQRVEERFTAEFHQVEANRQSCEQQNLG